MQPAHVEADLATVEDYRATPEGTRYQLIEGELHRMAPAPNLFHQEIVWNLSQILGRYLQTHPSTGRALFAPCDVYLTDHNVFQPDVLFVTAARASILQDDGVHGAPDLIVEVLCPGTEQLDKTTKRRVYAKAGVSEMWLINPLLRQIHLYVFAENPSKAVRILDDDESFSTPLLPGLTVQAAEVFKRG